MTPKKKNEHTHQYQRVELGKKGFIVYKCRKPGCTHYIQEGLAVDRMTECCDCHEVFTITQDHINKKRIRLRCRNCIDARVLTFSVSGKSEEDED